MQTAAYLELKNISKTVGVHHILSNISLEVYAGEFLCLLGPSGCGKTTLLKTIAGLERQSTGSIILKGKDISQYPPQQRDCGVLFQSYALFPNLTVSENIAYGLTMLKGRKHLIQDRVDSMLKMMEIQDHRHKYPSQLSGGQQQRVAMARALAPAPSILLLDEPMSALDAKVRDYLQVELRNLQKKLNITTIMVTHDQKEAMIMADRVAILNQGNLEQVGTAKNLYESPVNAFVAQFLGDTNWLDYDQVDDNHVRVGAHTLQLSKQIKAKKGKICIRPEALEVTTTVQSERANTITGKIIEHHFLGQSYRISILLEGTNDAMIHTQIPPTLGADVIENNYDKTCAVRFPVDAMVTYG